ncbi:MAG: AI-2E family transporter [Acidobacteriota bacterium]
MLFAAGALVPVLLVVIAWKTAQALLLLFAGYLLALFLRAPTDLMARRTRLSHVPAFTLVLVGLLGLAVGTGFWLAPRLAEQVQELSQQLPEAFRNLIGQVDDQWWFQRAGDRIGPVGGEGGVSWMQRALGIFSTAAGAVTGVLIVLWAGIYFAATPKRYTEGLLQLVPPERRGHVADVLGRTDSKLRQWMVGKVLAMAIVGVLSWVGLAALGIPLAFTLAVIAALLTFIPNFGPIASTIPPALLALAQSPIKALWVVLLFLAIQGVESYLLTPMIQEEAIEMPPGLLLASQIVFALLFGFMGVVVATPLMAALLVLVRGFYVEDVLEASAAPGRE